MSTRVSVVVFGPVHLFRDVTRPGAYFLDLGRGSYNRAWQVWPPTLHRLY